MLMCQFQQACNQLDGSSCLTYEVRADQAFCMAETACGLQGTPSPTRPPPFCTSGRLPPLEKRLQQLSPFASPTSGPKGPLNEGMLCPKRRPGKTPGPGSPTPQAREGTRAQASAAAAAAAMAVALSPYRPSSTHSSPCLSIRGEGFASEMASDISNFHNNMASTQTNFAGRHWPSCDKSLKWHPYTLYRVRVAMDVHCQHGPADSQAL